MTSSRVAGVVGSAHRSGLRELAWILGICLLTVLCANARVVTPLTPVPMTLHLVPVLLAGLILRPVSAAAAMVLYLGLGTVGQSQNLPIFSPGSLGLFGITAGYLVGFVFAAYLTAVIAREAKGVGRRFVAVTVGALCVLIFGTLWMAMVLEVSVQNALDLAFKPFVFKAAVEAAIAVAACEAFGFLASMIDGRSTAGDKRVSD